jgi:hypothetical protein
VIEVLACNWSAVRVYLRCQPTILPGERPTFLGVAAREIESVCRALRVRFRGVLLRRVQRLAQLVWQYQRQA